MREKKQEAGLNSPPHLLGALFWLHGTETEDQLWAAFRRAVDSGIGELVLESRPHWDYLGPKWWSDVKLLLDWSRKEHIRVYLFDEKWYPSGIAGGAVQKMGRAFRRMSVRYQSIRYRGPQTQVSLMPPWTNRAKSAILGVFAYPFSGGAVGWDRAVDLTDRLFASSQGHDLGIIHAVRWDVPPGDWIICFLIADSDDDYIDPMNADAVQAYISCVYEASDRQLSSYFNDPLAGFFFDEPGYFCGAGRFPWSPSLPRVFYERNGYDLLPYLPSLWLAKEAGSFRYDFFSTLNSFYADTFYRPIRDWCHNHGLRWIGHWYEHEACPELGERFMFHEGLAEGPGDYFEVARYPDEGGIDLVCNQVVPGQQNRDYWGLPKLASSASHIYGVPEDLAFCETFGAYGWHLGLRMMKWLTDWLAVRGINHLILHAFNPRWPDRDCPPYYFDGGNNPQWPYFPLYAAYANRLSSWLRGGRHAAPLLVLYPGALGYAGNTYPVEDTERFLQEIQYDYDLVPADVFIRCATAENRRIHIRQESYRGIVVSGQEVFTDRLLEKMTAFAKEGIPLIFLYGPPRKIVPDRGTERTADADLHELLSCPAVSVLSSHEALESCLMRQGVEPDVRFEGAGREGLRILHRISKSGKPLYFLNNESISTPADGRLRFPDPTGRITAVDPVSGDAWKIDPAFDGGTPVYLPPYRSLFLVPDAPVSPLLAAPPAPYRKPAGFARIPVPAESIALQWRDSRIGGLPSWLRLDPDFSGTADYDWETDLPDTVCTRESAALNLGTVHEIAEVFVNGHSAGISFVPPYRFDIRPLLTGGVNRFHIRVTNVVSNKMRNSPELKRLPAQEPADSRADSLVCEGGMRGPVSIDLD